MGKLILQENIAETILFLANELAGLLTGQETKLSCGHVFYLPFSADFHLK